MTDKPNILVVCSRNRKRSRTAESIFKNDSRFNIRSAGLRDKSERKISDKDILWSDIILTMEDGHKTWIMELFLHLDLPPVQVLNIPDEFDYMDSDLIDLLNDKINEVLRINFGIVTITDN
jgi:predicted protein tyrosine phosphatase